MMGSLRAAAFYTGYAVFTIIWGTISVLICWAMPFRWRFKFIIGAWTGVSLTWLRWTCGISARVSGSEHIPDKPCIVLIQHQSTWETAFAQRLFAPQATLIKRELLWIPFFGWAYALLRPIAINRGASRAALKQLIRQGGERIEAGQWVVLFPEGTRRQPGEIGEFFAGGAALASASEVPVLVVAHNAGFFWPAHQTRKNPGTIDVRISPLMDSSGKSTKAINAQCHAWMADQQQALIAAAQSQLGSSAPAAVKRPD